MESDCRLAVGSPPPGQENPHVGESKSLNHHQEEMEEAAGVDMAMEPPDPNVRNLSDAPPPSSPTSHSSSVGWFRCEEIDCDYTASTGEERSLHDETVHGRKKFRCNLCKFSCITHGGLYLHRNAVHLGIRFRCDKCSYEGTQEVNLKRHIESKHGNVLHCCKLCNVQTRVSYYAESHLKKKHGIMDKLQLHNFLEVKSISPKDPSGRDSEEERQLEEEMNEDEEEDDEGSYLDPSELLEQSDLIEDEAEEDDSSLLYPSVQMNTEGEDESVPDLEFLDPNAVAREPEFDNCHLKHKSPQFQCKKCDYVAQSSGTLTRHVSVVHKGVRWSCRLCGYVTTVKCSMVRHIQSIHQGWRYKCPFCPHESTQKGGLKYHIEKKHPEQLGAMPRWNSLAPVKTRSTTQIPGIEHMDVNQMFDELSDATSQDITDPVQKDLFSPIEGVAQMFARIREATPASPEPVAGTAEVGPGEEEVEEAESLEPSTAPGQYVGEDYDFTELYSRFTGYEDVSCDLCTYSTARMGNMRRHVLAVHQGVRFPCDLCNYRAPDKGSLLRHTRGVHQGIRYYCDFCPYSATQKGNLKKHQEMKHTDNNYDCMYCTFKVNWKGSFIKHLQSQHGDLMAAQGLGTTGETNPMLSFNVNTFADRSIQGMEEEEEEEELDKTEEGDSSLLCQEEEGELFQNQDAAEGYPIKTQNMSPTDKELEGSKVVVKTDSKQFQFKTEEMEGEMEDNGSSSTFQCSLCKYTANSSASLARHNGAVHKGIRWQCKDCDFITRDKSSLKRHRRNRHEGIRFKCNYCDYDAGQKGNIKSHMDRKHPEIPYDHTEFQEVKVEKSKYTREAKQEKEAVMRPDAQLAMSQMAAGLLGLGGLGGLNQFSAHLLTSLLQARMREDSNAFHSTDEDSNVQSSDKEEDQVDGHEEEDNNGAEVSEEPEVREESRPSSPPSPGPSLTSTPVKEHSSILFNALRTLPSASASPTLTPRKSLLDLLKINQDVLEGEQEAEEGPSEQQMGARARRPAAPDDLADGLACLECTFTARSQGTLFRHVQSVHRGIRFTCEYCDFVTIDKGSLKRHVNGQHKGLKHKCDFCEYENAQIGNVKKHIQTKHQNIVYHCPYCSLEAKHKWYLEQHVRKLHTDKLFVFDIKNVTPQAAAITPEIQGFPALPSPAGLLPSPGIVPPSLMLLHPMAKFFVPDALKNAQEDKDDTATNKIEFQNYDDEASEMAGTD